jgi:putative inorganic carbon (HCO3(-)) transporter
VIGASWRRQGMGISPAPARVLAIALTAGAAAALAFGAAQLQGGAVTDAAASVGILVAAALLYLLCSAAPVYIFTAAIVLSPFAGNWKYMGLPGPAAPDRLLFVLGVAVVLFRAYVSCDLPRPRIGFAHLLMAAALLFAACSALVYHDLLQKGPGLLLLETFGVLPFMTFWLGPVVYPTARERRILLVALVVLGAYLGLTALFETVKLNALVWPRYILNPYVGLHYGRARGPFIDAVANGVGLYVSAVASAIAARQWRGSRWRWVAWAICLLCLAGTIMTLERSIWIATAAATLLALLASRRTRRIAVPLVAGLAALIALTIFAVPGLHASVERRLHSSESIYDRLNVTHTALNMIQAKPLLGFGWDQYQSSYLPYVQQSPNIPLTGTQIDPHSAYLTYGVELGLVGGTLWLAAVLVGVGGTALARVPAELQPWRIGLLALLAFFLIGEAAVPPTVFVNASLWLWAGVVATARYPSRDDPLPVLRASPSRAAAPAAAPPGAATGST